MNPEKVEENTEDRGRRGEERNKILRRKECNCEMVLPWQGWGGKGTGRFDLRQKLLGLAMGERIKKEL